ncbi:MAG: hypothetical protein FWD34_08765 [Oscillospiraceae bacterium]|nr:hypothetical protein [Oscillospiraceae bacterium]
MDYKVLADEQRRARADVFNSVTYFIYVLEKMSLFPHEDETSQKIEDDLVALRDFKKMLGTMFVPE